MGGVLLALNPSLRMDLTHNKTTAGNKSILFFEWNCSKLIENSVHKRSHLTFFHFSLSLLSCFFRRGTPCMLIVKWLKLRAASCHASWIRPQVSNSRPSMPPRQFFDRKSRQMVALVPLSVSLAKTISSFFNATWTSLLRKAQCNVRLYQQKNDSFTASGESNTLSSTLSVVQNPHRLPRVCVQPLACRLQASLFRCPFRKWFDRWKTASRNKFNSGLFSSTTTWRLIAALAARKEDRSFLFLTPM